MKWTHEICIACIDAKTDSIPVNRWGYRNDPPALRGRLWRYYIGWDFESSWIDDNGDGTYSVSYQWIDQTSGDDSIQIETVYTSDEFADCVDIAICCYIPNRRYEKITIKPEWNI